MQLLQAVTICTFAIYHAALNKTLHFQMMHFEIISKKSKHMDTICGQPDLPPPY